MTIRFCREHDAMMVGDQHCIGCQTDEKERSAIAGRPRGADSRRRTREMLRHLTEGRTLADAARLAQVKPERVLRLLDEPEFRAAAVAIMDCCCAEINTRHCPLHGQLAA